MSKPVQPGQKRAMVPQPSEDSVSMQQSSASKVVAAKSPPRKRVRREQWPTGVDKKMMMGMKLKEAKTVLGEEECNRIIQVLGDRKGPLEARI